ncbi:uncharacterized protein LOC111691747 [Anoplophora glabripennis]|uniref:uncharacterized protein LOC111691747 n=1 Tax=Anoplophora glabripennis TaxID=217634 RepID=UPI000C77BCD4|nr:uncharacterized protein LOC111691747 [Anoplophora glabripennis]
MAEFRVNHKQSRKKKKKKPLKSLIAIIKIGILAAIAVGKITLLIKIFEAALKFKFLLVSAGGFLINLVKFWFDMRSKKHDDHENIVFKNPYEHSGDWSGGPGEYNARAYDIRKEYGQNLAYKGQKPQ